jgi:hypothetical protein
LKKLIISTAITATIFLSGCTTMVGTEKVKLTQNKPESVNLSDHMPEYYLSYQAGENEDGIIFASGFGEDDNLGVALEKASMDAHLTTSNMSGKSVIKSITREYTKTTDNTGKQQKLTASNGQYKKHYEKIVETHLPKTNVKQYKIVKKNVYQINGLYQAYVLISSLQLNHEEKPDDLPVQPITEALKEV